MTATASTVSPPGFAAGIWPCTTRLDPGGGIRVGGWPLGELARRHGTPLYILDEADVRYRCRVYRDAMPGAEIAYAGKAFLCRALADWIGEEGLSLDTCSAGELAVAQAVGFPAGRVLLHGNAKTPDDLRAATGYGVGRIVLDSAGEIGRLAAHHAGQAAGTAPGRTRRGRGHPCLGRGRWRRPEVRLRAQLRGGRGRGGPGAAAAGTGAHRPALPPGLADHRAAGVRAGRPAAHRADGGGSCRARPGPARAEPGRWPRRPVHRRRPRVRPARLRRPDPPGDPGRMCLVPAAGAAAHRGAGPRDHQPGHGHRVPGGRPSSRRPAGARSSPWMAG